MCIRDRVQTAPPLEAAEATDTATEAGESPSPVYNAETIIGGLGWYRSQYQRAMKLAVGLVLVLIVSIAVIALLIAKQPTPRYFAATPDSVSYTHLVSRFKNNIKAF